MWNWISKLKELQDKGNPFAIATITKSQGSTPRKVGAKMLICDNGDFYGTIGGGYLEKTVMSYAQECLAQNKSRTFLCPLDPRTDQVCGGEAEVFVEVVGSAPQIYIFGGGHVGQALCHVLQNTPFQIHLIDQRIEWIKHNSLPADIITHQGHWDEVIGELKFGPENTYAVVMTHAHEIDQEIISKLVHKPLKYRGMIGSRTKWNTFKKNLKEKGLTDDDLLKIKSPIGIAHTGKSPKEIAISVAAEVLEIHYNQ